MLCLFCSIFIVYFQTIPFQLVAQHGAEADKHLFRCLFSHVDFASDGRSNGKDFHQVNFLFIIIAHTVLYKMKTTYKYKTYLALVFMIS